ncbi:MAG: DUF6443 domain-containing protein [Prevotella sp.]|jgi:RHS repeat-associated protein|nr:DUF6443 domain-containing protein [Prevotella sp.]
MKIKHIYITIFMIIMAGNIYSQSTNQNYIRTRSYTATGGTSYLDVIQYFDGLGRPMQTVQKNIGPGTVAGDRKDLVVTQEYDSYGRELKTWLPATVAGNNGAYLEYYYWPTISTYDEDQNPYSEAEYEKSPFNRAIKQYGPGQEWRNNDKAIKTEFLSNKGTSGDLSCALFYVGGSGTSTKVEKYSYYTDGDLFVTKVIDEDGNISFEFKDKFDRVVLIRQKNGSETLDTHYVYDRFGNLCFVLPPLASDAIAPNNGTWDEASSTPFKLYAYHYKYDIYNRCIAKKIPGMDWIYYIYDKADRLIFSQDGEQRAKSPQEWSFSIPDAFGRIVLTGICKNTLNHTSNPLANEVIRVDYSATGTYKGYSIYSGYALTTPTILTVNYYDSYDFLSLNNITTAAYNTESGYGVQHTSAKGLLTGALTAQMNADGTVSSTYLYSAMYYDNKGRVVQTKSNNHLAGGQEKEYVAYNFTGQPTQTKHVHSATGKTIQTEIYTNDYDHAGRLLTTSHNLNNATTNTTLANNTYDDLGRLKTNQKHTHANLKTTYAYNIRSWTKSISSPLFKQTLFYNDRVTAHTYSDYKPSYSGNVSGMEWQVGTEAKRSYRFTYDGLSRIKHAGYNGLSSGGMYNVSYTYDKHGNIKTLSRRGKSSLAADNNAHIDNLTMTYVGNQLTKAEDALANIALAESGDFKNYSNVATEYTYNKNGAMNKDLNKGITSIQYNSLNLPRMMDIKSPVAEARNEYLYSAGGAKLRVTQKWNPNFSTAPVIGSVITVSALTQTKTTDYVGNKVYENGTLKRILVSGGYIEGTTYYFYQNDHLGNNRVVANASGTAIQKNHYYPFGMVFAETPLAEQQKQLYKYNGKELDQMHGLNLYDYSARQYDPAIGRFPTIDPLAEKYPHVSPYIYVENNPLKYIDIAGLTKFLSITMGKDVNYRGQLLSRNDNSVEHHNISNGIKGMVSTLKDATASDPEGIGFLSIFSHGAEGQIFGDDWRTNDNSIYSSDLDQLEEAIKNGDISFSRGAIIYLGACNAGTNKRISTSFAQKLANVTGATVVAANDRVGPKDETNGNMVYTVAHPRKNAFFNFGNSEPYELSNEVDVMRLLKQAKRMTQQPSENIEPVSSQDTWNKIMDLYQRWKMNNK